MRAAMKQGDNEFLWQAATDLYTSLALPKFES
jgi:hypothetical protein